MKTKFFALFLAIVITNISSNVQAATTLTQNGYTLEKVLIFSRHNIRAGLTDKNSTVSTYSNRMWPNTNIAPGHLTYKGGAAETLMGEYYRNYLEDEGFIPKDWIPTKDEVRFYANSFQRTIATARHFADGLSPLANICIEYHYDIDKSDPIFLPSSKISDPKVLKDYFAWYDALDKKTYFQKQAIDLRQIEKIIDFKNSEFAKRHGIKKIDTDKFDLVYKQNRIHKNSDYSHTTRIADNIMMRYYDIADDKKVVWHTSNPVKSLQAVGRYLTASGDLVWRNPAYAKHLTRKLLPEMVKELSNGRKLIFLCGHDTNLSTLLTTLDVEDFSLPNTITKRTPIGGKLVIEKRKGLDNKFYASFNITYAADKQLRNLEVLTINNPPETHPLIIKNLKRNQDGLYAWDDFINHLANCSKIKIQ